MYTPAILHPPREHSSTYVRLHVLDFSMQHAGGQIFEDASPPAPHIKTWRC